MINVCTLIRTYAIFVFWLQDDGDVYSSCQSELSDDDNNDVSENVGKSCKSTIIAL